MESCLPGEKSVLILAFSLLWSQFFSDIEFCCPWEGPLLCNDLFEHFCLSKQQCPGTAHAAEPGLVREKESTLNLWQTVHKWAVLAPTVAFLLWGQGWAEAQGSVCAWKWLLRGKSPFPLMRQGRTGTALRAAPLMVWMLTDHSEAGCNPPGGNLQVFPLFTPDCGSTWEPQAGFRAPLCRELILSRIGMQSDSSSGTGWSSVLFSSFMEKINWFLKECWSWWYLWPTWAIQPLSAFLQNVSSGRLRPGKRSL